MSDARPLMCTSALQLDDRFQNSNHRGPLENAAVLRTEAHTRIDRFHGFARLDGIDAVAKSPTKATTAPAVSRNGTVMQITPECGKTTLSMGSPM
jgi:hypothetical protein